MHAQLQPCQPSPTNQCKLLYVAGELYHGLDVPAGGNDGTVLFAALVAACKKTDESSAKGEDATHPVVQLLMRQRGPYALAFWHAQSQQLYFARDPFGRRSLLAHVRQDQFALCSCASGSAISAQASFAAAPAAHQDDSDSSAAAAAGAESMQSASACVEIPPGVHVIARAARKAGSERAADDSPGVTGAASVQHTSDRQPKRRTHWRALCLSASATYVAYQAVLQQRRPDSLLGNADVADGAAGANASCSVPKHAESAPVKDTTRRSSMQAAVRPESQHAGDASSNDGVEERSAAIELVMQELQRAVQEQCSTITHVPGRRSAWCGPSQAVNLPR